MKKYEINKNTLAIIAITNGISKVYEKDKTLYVYSPTIKIIDDSCKFFGSSYSGRFEGTKNLLNVSYKSPIIIEEQNNVCAICGCEQIHNGKPLVFVLDHIDGDASNNRRENLRCICPNCDSQLDTYKSKNKKSSRNYYRFGGYKNKKP